MKERASCAAMIVHYPLNSTDYGYTIISAFMGFSVMLPIDGASGIG